MIPRRFSVLRRRTGLIDMIVPFRPSSEAVAQYRLKTDVNPGGAFSTTCFTCGPQGFVDPTVAGPQHVIQPGNNVRMIFNPANYGLSDAAVWVKVVYIAANGSEMTDPAPGAATLLLPPNAGPNQFGFTATAPNGAAFANALQLDLPRVENFRLINQEAAQAMRLAFDGGGPEMTIDSKGETSGLVGGVTSIYVRGAGGPAAFTCSFSPSFPR